MTSSPDTPVEVSAVAAKHGGRLLPPARYRHPGDLIRLIIAGLVLAVTLTVGFAAHATYAGTSAAAVTAVAPSTLPGWVLAGLVQLLFAVGAVTAIAVTLRYRRFRLLAGLAGGAVLAGAALAGTVQLAGGERPRALAAGAGQWSWLTGAPPVVPVLLAAVAGTVAVPWLSRPWRRTAWAALWLAAIARLITGTASPMEVVVAFGPALITLADIGALAASVQAFGGGPGVVLVGAVYLSAAAIAAAAPSPGGLGAIEAALVAGLMGRHAGRTRRFRGAAVPAGDLLAPHHAGWLSWRVLQRRDYV